MGKKSYENAVKILEKEFGEKLEYLDDESACWIISSLFDKKIFEGSENRSCINELADEPYKLNLAIEKCSTWSNQTFFNAYRLSKYVSNCMMNNNIEWAKNPKKSPYYMEGDGYDYFGGN